MVAGADVLGAGPQEEVRHEGLHVQRETLVKMPGEVGGQQFIIERCTDCNIPARLQCELLHRTLREVGPTRALTPAVHLALAQNPSPSP